MEPRRSAVWAKILLVTAGYWLIALALAFSAGAFDGSWGSDPDEASHFLNGVMVLDYVKGGLPEHPLRYAERYYEHYPKIGLGHWPPLLAIVEAAWFLVIPLSYGAGIVLISLLAAGVAAEVWWMGRRWCPEWLAGLAGAVWLLLPVVRQYSVIFMAEMLLAFCVTAAVLAFARQSVWFGIWAGLALLTKGTAIAVAPLPVIAAIFAGDWKFLRRRFLWLSALVVVLLAAGWYAKAPGARHERVAPFGGITLRPQRVAETLHTANANLGPALGLLAIAGMAAAWRKRKQDTLLLAVLAFLPSHLVFRMVIGAWETRHLVMVYPELLLLSAYGLEQMRRRIEPRWGQILVVAVAIGTGAHLAARWPERIGTNGFDEAARALQGTQRILVAGTIPAEGALICSVALGDRRPERTVDRATKVLLKSDFLGWHEQMLVNTPQEAGSVLDERRIDAVVLDRKGEQRYVPLLREYMRDPGKRWEESAVYQGRAEVWVRMGQKGQKIHKDPR